ncbi:MAG: T9SS type A sorting domain-containing protein [Saprospiraceae bacterium]|nr:T9SS type A sorting domain-containing protein [Saprospiraceae bacterium]
MKIIIPFIFYPFLLLSQEFKIIGVSFDNKYDTLTIGFRTNANLGIDSSLNEVNIFGQTVTKSVDIRIVQRDSSNFSCTYPNGFNSSKIFYPQNFDSKINWRSNKDTTLLNRTFEIQCLTPNIRSLIFRHNLGVQPITFFENNFDYQNACGVEDQFSVFIVERNMIQFISTNSPFSNLIIVFRKGLLLETQSIINPKPFRVYPNPFNTELSIQISEKQHVSEIQIQDVLGRLVFIQKYNEDKELISLNLHGLQKGSYYLTLYDSHGKVLGSQLIVK